VEHALIPNLACIQIWQANAEVSLEPRRLKSAWATQRNPISNLYQMNICLQLQWSFSKLVGSYWSDLILLPRSVHLLTSTQDASPLLWEPPPSVHLRGRQGTTCHGGGQRGWHSVYSLPASHCMIMKQMEALSRIFIWPKWRHGPRLLVEAEKDPTAVATSVWWMWYQGWHPG
jgi:hypothetical protein